MSELWVDPAGLRRAAEGFTRGSKKLEQIHQTLDGRLSAEGKCWGADETGQQFEKDYLQPSQEVSKAFGELSKALSAIKDGLDKMAKSYEEAEEKSKGAVKGVGKG